MNVLVVEDVSVIRMMITFELDEPDWTVIEAGSVGEALACWEEARIDAAIIDIDLPDGRGTELIARFRAEMPDLLIVVHTAYRENDPEISKLPADIPIIAKPARNAAIARALRSTMDIAPIATTELTQASTENSLPRAVEAI